MKEKCQNMKSNRLETISLFSPATHLYDYLLRISIIQIFFQQLQKESVRNNNI